MNRENFEKLSEIINNYSSKNKELRNDSEKKLFELRKKNMGLLCLRLLELSNLSNVEENIKISCLVLLRNIIEIDSKTYWGNIGQKIKEKIKQSVLDIILNNKSEFFLKENNRIIFLIEQLVHTVEDFNENWPELINLTNILLIMSFPKDINKIDSIIKTINHCLSILSNEILFHLNNFNAFFKDIFDYNSKGILKILDTKVKSCQFYSELISFSLNNNLDDISSSFNFISTNMIKTLNECLQYINNLNNIDIDEICKIDIENLIFDLLSCIEILLLPDVFEFCSDISKDLNILLNSIIKLPSIKYQKIIEKSFHRLLDIYLKEYISNEEKEKLIKEYINNLFKYAYNNLDIAKNLFCSVLNEYDDYELVPKINDNILIFIFDLTSQMIQEDEKCINILQELENNLLNQIDRNYKYIGLLLLPQLIESRKNFIEVESYINICFINITSQYFEIRYAAFYSINYYITNFWTKFYEKYSFYFLKLIIEQMKFEQNLHVKCEIISVFNCFISHLDDDDDVKIDNYEDITNEKNKIINDSKIYLNNNIEDIFSFLLNEFNKSKINDSNKCLIKNELFKSLIICCQIFCDANKPFFENIQISLIGYLENIFQNKIYSNLYINLLNTISYFGKYENNLIIQKINLLFNTALYISKNISLYINKIDIMNSIIKNFLPIINMNKPEYISEIISSIMNSLNILNEEIKENDTNHVDEICSLIEIINTSFEIIDEKCIDYLIQIETCLEKVLSKLKNISKINNIISDILCNVIQIISKHSTKKVIKSKGKIYLEIIFNMIENEYNTSTTIQLVDNLNKIFEIIVENLTQNELEQIFNGIIKLIEFFENKIELFTSKKKTTEKEIRIEEEMSMSLELDNEGEEEEDEKKEFLERFDEDIENLEQVNESLSFVIENMMKYSSGKKLKNISEVIYNKIIPLLINSNTNSGNNIKIAVNLIDDIFEYLNFNKFSPYIIKDLIIKLIHYSKYPKSEVRQAANYGLGIFIKLSENDIYKIYSEKILYALNLSCISFPNNNSQNEKQYRANGLAYENAIASIGKAIEYKEVKEKEYIILWIDNLPLNIDETEMEEGHNILCNFIINEKYKKYNIEELNCNKITKIIINIYKDEKKSSSEINNKIELLFKKEDFKDILKNIYIESLNGRNNDVVNKIKFFIN